MQCYETRVLLSDAMNDSDFPTSRAAYILSGVNKPSGAEPISACCRSSFFWNLAKSAIL